MQIILNEKTYISPPAKGRMVRKAIEITEKTNFENLKTTDLDNLVGYVVELFGAQFTIDDVYDGLPATELLPMVMNCLKSVVADIEAKVEEFPNVPTGA